MTDTATGTRSHPAGTCPAYSWCTDHEDGSHTDSWPLIAGDFYVRRAATDGAITYTVETPRTPFDEVHTTEDLKAVADELARAARELHAYTRRAADDELASLLRQLDALRLPLSRHGILVDWKTQG